MNFTQQVWVKSSFKGRFFGLKKASLENMFLGASNALHHVQKTESILLIFFKYSFFQSFIKF